MRARRSAGSISRVAGVATASPFEALRLRAINHHQSQPFKHDRMI
jgi:hypothetical protein